MPDTGAQRAGDGLLQTKILLPQRKMEQLARPRLVQRLDDGLQRRLTLISAPAGFGKTTLLTEWLATTRFPELRVAWLSLDEPDSDPSTFWSYFILALRSVQPGIAEMLLPMLQAPQARPIQSILAILINEVSALDEPFTMVLDDYHVIQSETVHEGLAFLVEHLPRQMHLVVASRSDPPLPLARLRARREVSELRAADLRFTSDEAAAFFNEVLSLGIDPADIEALEARTEGWIAALQLAALSLQGRQDVAAFVRSFTGDDRYIVDYLVDEVLRRQPEPVRRFLLYTSIVERLNASLCDAINQSSDSRAVLVQLERQNLFLVPLDSTRQWYRYHRLFADVLQAHLQDEWPQELEALHQRASEWFDANNMRPEAIRHALAAGNHERAADLIELAWPEMDRSFRPGLWLTWVRALPEALLSDRPVLGVDYAWALLDTGDFEGGMTRLESAVNSLARPDYVVIDHDHFRSLPASIAMARSYYAQVQGDHVTTIEQAKQALEVLPEDDLVRRGVIDALQALAYWSTGELELAYEALEDGTANFEKAGSIQFAISGAFILADIRTVQGRLRDAIAVYERALNIAQAHGEPAMRGTSDIYLGLSELHRERGEVALAEEYLRRCNELDDSAGQAQFRYRWNLAEARRLESAGDFAGSLENLDEAERNFVAGPLPDVRPISAIRARIWTRQDNIAAASGWARAKGLESDDEMSFLREAEHITFARLLLAKHRIERDADAVTQAIKLLSRLLSAAVEGGRNGSAIEILVLLSLAGRAHNDTAGAMSALKQALTLGEPESFVRVFCDEGEAMRDMVTRVAGEAELGAYARHLLHAFHDAAGGATTVAQKTPSSLVEPLTTRELEILRLVAAGLTNQQIADHLVISVATAKRHIANAYSKLGAGHRTEAVARATELRLI